MLFRSYAASIGLAGIVIDGAIRDVAEIREREFPVYARGVTHRGPYKDGPGEINVAVSVGGILTFYAASIDLAGVVIDGAIRDVAEIREREFPVYARGVTHRGPYKDGPGEINVPICVGGMVVNPGDIVVGDQDGLLAIPQEGVGELIHKARAVLTAEAETLRAMKEGRWSRAFIDALEARCNN